MIGLAGLTFAGCNTDHYEIELTPDGESMKRDLTVWCEEESDGKTRIVALSEKDFQRITAAYQQPAAGAKAKKYRFSSRFREAVPDDVGGAGWYLPLKNLNDPNIRITARLASPLANLEDHDTWTREGLIDGLCAPFNTFAAAKELKTILPDAKSHIQGPCQFAVCLGMTKTPAAIKDCARVAYENGAEYLFVRESYDIRTKPAVWDAFKQVAERYSGSS